MVSIVFDEEVEDDEDGDDVLDPIDLELRIELTMLLGTSHLSIKSNCIYNCKTIFDTITYYNLTLLY